MPLIFVHGLGCASSCDYPRVAADPALAGRRAILVDLVGSGFCEAPLAFDYSIAAQARTIVELVDRLGLAAVDLYGHSMGGAIAIDTAHRLGRRVRHLVVSEPNLDPGGGSFSRAIAETDEADWVRTGHSAQIAAARAGGNVVWAASLAASVPHAVHRAARSLVAGSTPSWRDLLHAIPADRTIAFGARSLPDVDAERLPARGIHVEIVAGAGHSMAWDNPGGLAEALARATARPVPDLPAQG